jgi:hypothetical protein
MPHATLKLVPGINRNETFTLNETGFAKSNLVRFIPDSKYQALIQKLGGWTKFYDNTFPAIIRALLAWEDTNSKKHLAVGTGLDAAVPPAGYLGVLTDGVLQNITPQKYINSIPVAVAGDVQTTSGSNIVKITDTSFTASSQTSVFISTPISAGGLILFGLYQCTFFDSTHYTIAATTPTGLPINATSSVTSGVVPLFDTTSGSASVKVTLPANGYQVGDTFPVLVPVTVGGVTLSGNYIIQSLDSITPADIFYIVAQNSATSTASAYENNGNAYLVYNVGLSPTPPYTGYGAGGYGSGGYGVGSAVVTSFGYAIPTTDWSLETWGEILISCAVSSQEDGQKFAYAPIYQWSPQAGTPTAQVIVNAPPINDGAFVAMPQRQVIAWGSSFNGVQDPLLLRWCDVENYDVWVAQAINQAGSYRIPKGSRIVSCIQGPQQGLVWTDIGLWAMQYIGAPYVYSFNEIGNGCGLVARKAATSLNGIVYWMGPTQFYRLAGQGVETLPCSVWDVIFQDLDTANVDKIRVAANSRFGEISWFYPTKSNGGEVNAYVKYNTLLNVWDYGTLSRTAWINESVLGPPIGAAEDRYIYQHETSNSANGNLINASFQTGYFSIENGDLQSFVDQIWPDMRWGLYDQTQNASVNITFYVSNYPGDTPRQYGPYTVTQATQFVSTRMRGRLVSINVSSADSDVNGFWRIGGIRYRYQPDGKY